MIKGSWIVSASKLLALPLLLVGMSGCTPSKSVVFVVDTSGSMKRDHLIDDVKRSIKKILLQYGKGDQIYLLTFDGEARLLLERTLATNEDTAAVFDAVDSIEANGRWTDLVGALDASLRRAVDLQKLDVGRTTLVLYTDGKHDPSPEAKSREVQNFSDLVKAYYSGYRPGDSWFIFYVELDESEPALKRFLDETGSGRVVEKREFTTSFDFTELPKSVFWVSLPFVVVGLLFAFFFLWFLPWLRNVSLVPLTSAGTVDRKGSGIPLESFRRGAFARFLGFGKPTEVHLSFGASKVDVSVDSKGAYFLRPVSGQNVRVDGKIVTAKQTVKPGQKIQIGASEYVLERSARRRH